MEKEKFLENFEMVIKMVSESTVLKEKSLNRFCVCDEYDQYVLTADWCEGRPTLYIVHDNINGHRNICYEVKEISKIEIVYLLDAWQEIVSMFEED